jgi:hypothetical protein
MIVALASRRPHAAIVGKVLRSGTIIHVGVQTVSPSPAGYVIQRSVPNPPVVLDEAGSATTLQPADVIGHVEIFGQHELADLASDKTRVAEMIERFVGESQTGN